MSETEHTPDDGAGLVVSRLCNAPPEAVFKKWTDPRRVKRWWGPKGFSTPVCTIDLRPGGTFRYCMRSPEGRDYWGVGIYTDVSAPDRLVYLDSFSDEEGNRVDPAEYGMSPEHPSEALVTVTFEENEDGTEVTVRHDIPESLPERSACWQGWSEMLDKLADECAEEERT